MLAPLPACPCACAFDGSQDTLMYIDMPCKTAAVLASLPAASCCCCYLLLLLPAPAAAAVVAAAVALLLLCCSPSYIINHGPMSNIAN